MWNLWKRRKNYLVVYINQNICVDIDLLFCEKYIFQHFMLKTS
jgi:hypothetical protein